MRSPYLLVPSAALLHLAVSGLLLLLSAGASLGTFERGPNQALLAQVLNTTGTILLYPVFIPATGLLTRPSSTVAWVLLILNSFVWAAAAVLLLKLVRARTIRRARTA